MHADLGRRLAALAAELDVEQRLAADPIRFPRRYVEARDVEIAAVVASGLAYGRVDLFSPVLERIFAIMDRGGGPRAYVDAFDPARDGAALRPIVYRWNTGVDLILLFAALRAVTAGVSLADRFAWDAADADAGAAIERGVRAIRVAAVEVALSCGVSASSFADLPRGFKMIVPVPSDGSACKRWNMMVRWLVRGPDAIDLGIWSHIPRSALIIPLDTHVARIARLVGLTSRADGSWRTAREVTDALRQLNASDPVGYDFAIAHLGISGACAGRFEPAICPGCPLAPVCIAAVGC